jgi:D-alanyl-D-alanine carboxypeptidase
LSMSASDLAKWDIARIDRTILTPADWQAQETPIRLSDGSNSRYGLGVFIGSQDGRKMIEHSGEAVGFISENLVFPDDKAAFVVLTNTWSAGAASDIATKLSKALLPPAPANAADVAAGTRARALFDLLRAGQIDRAELTDDANFYFTPTAIADFKASLAPLGTPESFTQAGPVRLRGGFVLRSYRLVYKEKTLILSTFLEPGDHGRFEQFLISPAN